MLPKKEYKYGAGLDMEQGLPFEPQEIEPLRGLVQVSASSIVEGGRPLR